MTGNGLNGSNTQWQHKQQSIYIFYWKDRTGLEIP